MFPPGESGESIVFDESEGGVELLELIVFEQLLNESIPIKAEKPNTILILLIKLFFINDSYFFILHYNIINENKKTKKKSRTVHDWRDL